MFGGEVGHAPLDLSSTLSRPGLLLQTVRVLDQFTTYIAVFKQPVCEDQPRRPALGLGANGILKFEERGHPVVGGEVHRGVSLALGAVPITPR